jgi:type IV secretion system protein VirD4
MSAIDPQPADRTRLLPRVAAASAVAGIMGGGLGGLAGLASGATVFTPDRVSMTAAEHLGLLVALGVLLFMAALAFGSAPVQAKTADRLEYAVGLTARIVLRPMRWALPAGLAVAAVAWLILVQGRLQPPPGALSLLVGALALGMAVTALPSYLAALAGLSRGQVPPAAQGFGGFVFRLAMAPVRMAGIGLEYLVAALRMVLRPDLVMATAAGVVLLWLWPPAGIGLLALVALFGVWKILQAVDGHRGRQDQRRHLDEQRTADRRARQAHGDAALLADFELLQKGYLDGQDGQGHGPLLGRSADWGQPIRYRGEAHLLTFAATGQGKGVGAVIPNLLDHPGSVLAIDPKGENARVSAPWRRHHLRQAVHVLDPWNLSGQGGAAFNPLDWIVDSDPDHEAHAARIADALVEARSDKDPHWDEQAKSLIRALILYVAFEEPKEHCHLLRVARLLRLSGAAFGELLETMQGSARAPIAEAGGSFAGTPERELGSILSTARRHTEWLAIGRGRFEPVLTRSTFDPKGLKGTRPVSVFLVLPESEMGNYGRWLRLMVTMTLTAMSRIPRVPEHRVLFLLDEAAKLGHLRPVEEGLALMRGYGVQLWPIFQDLSQLEALYPRSWQSWIANAGAIQVFGVSDARTAEFFSRKAGQQGRAVRTDSRSRSEQEQSDRASEQESHGFTYVAAPLIRPEEIMQLPGNSELIFFAGEQPAQARKLRYYDDRLFVGRFDLSWREKP